ncbi:hypothetical protein SH661x_000611 [Planctomicrobium sp. SH661]|uniref:hypothetical protein n=1 Tax=Planctomicrobium sp. SH661 TaxID=3448124 RepID=UPI003F5B4F85
MTASPFTPAESEPSRAGEAANWRYILIDQGLIAIPVNFGINWGIAWSVFRRMPVVPLRGELSLESDTIATCWMLPLISCLIVTGLTRLELRRGRVPGWQAQHAKSAWADVLFNSLVARATAWGVAGRVLVAPLAVWLISASGLENLPFWNFLLFKATFASVLGIFFCPAHAWWALHDRVSRNVAG